MLTSVGYHPSEPLKMDPEFGGGSPPFAGNEEDYEAVGGLPPGALPEHMNNQVPVINSQQQQALGHHPQQSQPPPQQQQHYAHYAHYAPQQASHHHWGHPYAMNNGYGGSYVPPPPPQQAAHHIMDSSYNSYYGQQHYTGSSGGMALPGGPSPAGSHNTPSPQAISEDGEAESRGGSGLLKRDYPPLMNYGPPPVASSAAKKAKAPKRKKKRDPNEPQKPVSAYALFFRDSQANIKAANPNAAFGDVSKIVASMWDGLDPDNKAAYKKRTENAKKEYLKKLAAYRASLVSKGSGSPINESGAGNPAPSSYGGPYAPAPAYSPYGEPACKPSPNEGSGYAGGPPSSYPPPPSQPQQQIPRQPSYGPPPGYMHPSQQMSNGGYGHHVPHHPPGSNPEQPNHRSSTSPPSGSPHDSRTHLDPSTGHMIEAGGPDGGGLNNGHRRPPGSSRSCARPGCNNPISNDTSWGEYCSNECVVGQCRDVVYPSWSSAGPPSAGSNGGQVQTQ